MIIVSFNLLSLVLLYNSVYATTIVPSSAPTVTRRPTSVPTRAPSAPTSKPTAKPSSPTSTPTTRPSYGNKQQGICPLRPASSGALSFMFLADWGQGSKSNNPAQYTVADQMKRVAKLTNTSFILSAGNFMVSKKGGVYGVDDPQWGTVWYQVYSGVLQNITWYPAMGGWDWGHYTSYTGGYLPNPEALIQYTTYAAKHGKWTMPDHNYTVTYEVPGSGHKHIQIVVIDTGRITNGDPGIDLLIKNLPLVRAQHIAWLESVLADSQATWLFVMGTYQIYTSTVDSTPDVEKYVLPLLKKYNVTAYLHGHEHIAHHIVTNGINFIDAGASGGKFDSIAAAPYVPHASDVKFVSTNMGSFALFQAYSNHITLNFIDEYGNNIYCANLTSNVRNVNDPPPPTFYPTVAPSAPTIIPSSSPSAPSSTPTVTPTRPTVTPTTLPSVVPTGSSLLPKNSKVVSFLAMGDWGTGNDIQKKIADQMSVTSLGVGASFIVSTGDNFYYMGSNSDIEGVSSVDDYSWQWKYKNVYTGDGVKIPIYAVLGNHDYGKGLTSPKTSAQAQILYTRQNKDNGIWNMPDHNFTKIVNIPDSDQRIEIVFIDTCRLSPSETAGTTTAYGMSQSLINKMQADHLQWINNTLKASTAAYLVVVGHYQVYADLDDSILVNYLTPLFRQYNVTAYINGHRHTLLHYFYQGTNYITTGAAGGFVDPVDPKVSTSAAASGYKFGGNGIMAGGCGFTVFQATKFQFRFTFVDGNGAYLYSARMNPRTTVYTAAPTTAPAGTLTPTKSMKKISIRLAMRGVSKSKFSATEIYALRQTVSDLLGILIDYIGTPEISDTSSRRMLVDGGSGVSISIPLVAPETTIENAGGVSSVNNVLQSTTTLVNTFLTNIESSGGTTQDFQSVTALTTVVDLTPTSEPTRIPTTTPTLIPTPFPSSTPTLNPSTNPSTAPVITSSTSPSTSPTVIPTLTPVASSPGSSSQKSCFAGSERVTLESGEEKLISEVQVGDRALSYSTRLHAFSYSDVIAIPHGRNEIAAVFIQLLTSSASVKMTPAHLVLSGDCGSTLTLKKASEVHIGACLQTVRGIEKVLEVSELQAKGIYSMVVKEEFIVVGGVVSSPFAVYHYIPSLYYDLYRYISSVNPKLLQMPFIKSLSSFVGDVFYYLS